MSGRRSSSVSSDSHSFNLNTNNYNTITSTTSGSSTTNLAAGHSFVRKNSLTPSMNSIHSTTSSSFPASASTPAPMTPLSPWMSYSPDVPVEIRMGKEGPASSQPLTVIDVFESVAVKYANKKALATWKNNKWNFITYAQYNQFVKMAAKSFIAVSF